MVSQVVPVSTDVSSRLRALRGRMAEAGIDIVVVRSTDGFLNEYVPEDQSSRAFITGFAGSMGDALVTQERAILFVDGRYELQAAKEAPDYEVRVLPLGTTIEAGWLEALAELARDGARVVGLETDRIPVSLYATVAEAARRHSLELRATLPSLVEEVWRGLEGPAPKGKGRFWSISATLSGRTVAQRLDEAAPAFDEAGVDGYVVVPLDEIAWLTNLRGDQLPYQATFRSQALALRDRVLVAANPSQLRKGAEPEAAVALVGEGKLAAATATVVRERGSLTLGFDPSSTPEAVRAALEAAGARLLAIDNPFVEMRTRKTEAELRHMASAFARADEVVRKARTWLSGRVNKGIPTTEAEVAAQVRKLFKRSGAWGLSFQVIAAAGRNGAQIHYSKPDPTTPIERGTTFLLDTGGYYEGGYATDLTRTFLVGGAGTTATDEQKRWFTLVLKAAIAGLRARFPRGTTGEQLDAIVRTPLWAAGLNYGHGTGHGVGVNVHEFPPRVAPGVRSPLQPGQVFSIEPGVYRPDFGGVRIENLVTCVVDPDDDRFLRIRPLTFSPLDTRLIDRKLLSVDDKAFLRWFDERRKAGDGLDGPLPPLAG